MQLTNQLKYMSSKVEQANFDQNSWADTLLWDMTTLKRYVDPRTPASQLSPLFPFAPVRLLFPDGLQQKQISPLGN